MLISHENQDVRHRFVTGAYLAFAGCQNRHRIAGYMESQSTQRTCGCGYEFSSVHAQLASIHYNEDNYTDGCLAYSAPTAQL